MNAGWGGLSSWPTSPSLEVGTKYTNSSDLYKSVWSMNAGWGGLSSWPTSPSLEVSTYYTDSSDLYKSVWSMNAGWEALSSWPTSPSLEVSTYTGSPFAYCPPLSRKRGDIKSHLSVRPSLCLSVTKTLTLAMTFALLKVELWYLACVFFVTRPFRWYHVVTLTVTFDLLQGQICWRAGGPQFSEFLIVFR